MTQLATWLRALADWLAPQEPAVRYIAVPPTPSPYSVAAGTFVRKVEAELTDQTGEYKRHIVYSRLIKQYPDARKRDLAFAIEQVMQEL